MSYESLIPFRGLVDGDDMSYMYFTEEGYLRIYNQVKNAISIDVIVMIVDMTKIHSGKGWVWVIIQINNNIIFSVLKFYILYYIILI